MNEAINVLLVEDSAIPQMVATRILKAAGCHVDVASTGKEGLEKAQQNQYDIIFMDIGLEEGTDGFLITQEIQSNSINNDTDVVILSSHSPEGFAERLELIKILTYLIKPLTQEKLEKILKQIKK